MKPLILALLLAPLAALSQSEPKPSITGGKQETADAIPAPFSIREAYCPAHFGNSYEAMGQREKATYLAELKWMGFNQYGDWLTTTDCSNPYASTLEWTLGKVQLDRKIQGFRAARQIGLASNLIISTNHVYLDQLQPDYLAKKSKRVLGQLVCPSKPEGRKVILENFRRWFDDLADAGVHLNVLTAFAYDYGGCDCEQCRPWIVTFARLFREIHAIAQKRHPGIEPWVCSWWWTSEEHAQFNEWAAAEAPGWIKGMTMHIAYDNTTPLNVPVPDGCKKLAFVHIGYNDKTGKQKYGSRGAVIAPQRISETLRQLRRSGFEGFQAYSEGVFDDLNKMLLAGIGSGTYRDDEAALRSYVTRYFKVPEDASTEWAKWMRQWGRSDESVPLPDAAEDFAKISNGLKSDWRLEIWRSRVELETLDRAIGLPKAIEWTPEKLALADKWFDAQERLYREVYRLGPMRNVLNPGASAPAWYNSWRAKNPNIPAPLKTHPVLPQQ